MALRRIIALACEEAFGFSHMPAAVCVKGRPWRIVSWSQPILRALFLAWLACTLNISIRKRAFVDYYVWLEPIGNRLDAAVSH